MAGIEGFAATAAAAGGAQGQSLHHAVGIHVDIDLFHGRCGPCVFGPVAGLGGHGGP